MHCRDSFDVCVGSDGPQPLVLLVVFGAILNCYIGSPACHPQKNIFFYEVGPERPTLADRCHSRHEKTHYDVIGGHA